MHIRTLALGVALAGLVTVAGAAGHRGDRPDFETLDSDGDGRLSAAELQELPTRRGMDPARRFERLDADSDGFVTREELQQAAREMRERGPRAAFEELDTDGDGRLSEAELAELPVRGRGSAERRFDHLDADDDGYITRDELQSAGRHRQPPE